MASSPRAAFAYTSFSRFMAARFLTTIASEMQSVAVGWQLYEITHRALDLGLAGLAQFLPGFLLFLVAGQAADRFARRRILQVCYLGFSLCSLSLLAFTLAHVRTPLPIYAVLLLNGTVRAFNGPASQSMIPSLVPPAVLTNAIAWGSSIFQSATITGPMVGGTLYGLVQSPAPVYAIAAACTVLSFSFLCFVEAPRSVRRVSANSTMLLDGIRYMFRNKLVLGAISLDLFAVLLGGAVALLPVFAEEILKGGAVGLGILRSSPGIGAVLMSLVVAYVQIRRKAGPAMLLCVFLYGLFTVLFGLSHVLALSVVLLVLAGAADTVSVIVRHTLIQLATPDEMRGRVSAVNMVFIGASNELGQFESGLTAHWFGAVPAVILGGAGTILVVLLWSWLFPGLRKLDRLEDTAAVPADMAAVSHEPGTA